jgi:hypothetical protein
MKAKEEHGKGLADNVSRQHLLLMKKEVVRRRTRGCVGGCASECGIEVLKIGCWDSLNVFYFSLLRGIRPMAVISASVGSLPVSPEQTVHVCFEALELTSCVAANCVREPAPC